MVHGRQIQIRRLDIRDRQQRKRRERRNVDRLQVAAARAARFDPPILALLIGRRRDELIASIVAVDAGVGGQLPGARAERTAERPMTADDFGEGRPGSARGTVSAVPRGQRADQGLVRRASQEQRLQRVDERADGELGDEPDEIGREPAVRGARPDGGLLARKGRRQERARLDVAADDRVPDVGRGVTGAALPPARRRSARAPVRGLESARESARRPEPARRARVWPPGISGGNDRRGSRPCSSWRPSSDTSVISRRWSAMAGVEIRAGCRDRIPPLLSDFGDFLRGSLGRRARTACLVIMVA